MIFDPAWEKEIRYLDDALVGEATLRRKDLDPALVCRGAVDFHADVYMRRERTEEKDLPEKLPDLSHRSLLLVRAHLQEASEPSLQFAGV